MGVGVNLVIGKIARFHVMVGYRKDFVPVIALPQPMVVMTAPLMDPIALKRESATKFLVQVSNPQIKKKNCNSTE